MAKKETLVCKPCGTMVVVSDQGAAVIECYQCGSEMSAKTARKPAAKKALKAAPKKAAAKKPAARKVAPKKKK
jgi:DNA-directed RNA polymerase subunit M/transcription elongation factor TFIIS